MNHGDDDHDELTLILPRLGLDLNKQADMSRQAVQILTLAWMAARIAWELTCLVTIGHEKITGLMREGEMDDKCCVCGREREEDSVFGLMYMCILCWAGASERERERAEASKQCAP